MIQLLVLISNGVSVVEWKRFQVAAFSCVHIPAPRQVTGRDFGMTSNLPSLLHRNGTASDG
jgi:hypothetical protein